MKHLQLRACNQFCFDNVSLAKIRIVLNFTLSGIVSLIKLYSTYNFSVKPKIDKFYPLVTKSIISDKCRCKLIQKVRIVTL